MKKNKHHWYSDESGDDFGPTACGRDGKKVGSLITGFFEAIKPKDRCKICNKKFLERQGSENGKKGID